MRTDPVVIDLGVIDLGPDRSAPGDEPGGSGHQGGPDGPTDAPRRPGSPALAMSPTTRLVRWWPLVALTVVLVANTSAARPVTPDLSLAFQLPTAQATSVALTGQTLYVATGTPASVIQEDPEWTLTAYSLADGTPRWTVPLDPTTRPSSVALQVVEDLLLVTGWREHISPLRPPIQYDGHTAAYDAGTGSPRWSYPGFPAGAQDGRMAFDQVRYEGNPPEETGYLTATVELETGQVLWRHQLELGDEPFQLSGVWALSGDGRYLATLERDGWLTVNDLATGRGTSTSLGQSWRDASLAIADGLLRITMLKDRQKTLTAYDLVPLAERWTITDLFPTATLRSCGPVLCLIGLDGLDALDPATGNRRWHAEQTWLSASLMGPPWPDGQLEVGMPRNRPATESSEDSSEDSLVVDAATGEERFALGDWVPLRDSHHPYPLVQMREEGANYPGHPDFDPGRLWLGRADPDRRQIDVLGAIDHVSSCQAGAQHLACVSTQHRVELWRLR